MDTNVRKQKALSEFNLRQNSVFWNARENSLRTEKLAKHVGVPKSTMQEWYAIWRDDNNTTLAGTSKMLRSEGLRRRGLYFQELKDGSKITVIQAAVKYGVSRSAIRFWRREYEKENNLKLGHNHGGRKPFIKIENIQGESELKVITESQKVAALREFNLKEKSKFWDAKLKTIRANALGKSIGVSFCTIYEWYARWQADNNTKLGRVPVLSWKEYDERKWKYFEELGRRESENSPEIFTAIVDAIKNGVASSTIDNWRKEYVKNGGKRTWLEKGELRRRRAVVKSIEPKKVIEKPQEILPQKPVESSIKPILNTNGKADVETLDNFFESIAKQNERMKQMEVELKSYKEKCAKWAAQVVTLQNAMAVRG